MTYAILHMLDYNGVARAAAAAASAATSGPTPDIPGLLGLLLTGHYLPAVGGAIVLGVGLLRAGATRLGWGIGTFFASKIGGYALAYGTTYALYIGAAWYAGSPFDATLLLTAFGVALTSSGVLDHWRDIVDALTSKNATEVAGAVAKVGAIALLIFAFASCGAGSKPRVAASAGVGQAFDCEAAHFDSTVLADAKAFAAAKLRSWLSGTGHPSSDAIAADLKPFGSDLFHCAFDGVVAAATTLITPQPGVSTSALASGDTSWLGSAYADAKSKVGWAPVRASP